MKTEKQTKKQKKITEKEKKKANENRERNEENGEKIENRKNLEETSNWKKERKIGPNNQPTERACEPLPPSPRAGQPLLVPLYALTEKGFRAALYRI